MRGEARGRSHKPPPHRRGEYTEEHKEARESGAETEAEEEEKGNEEKGYRYGETPGGTEERNHKGPESEGAHLPH